ncbi:MAG: energy-coupling factor ABC transporter substrate-binding protein [Chloroflexota bacterium]
MTGKVEPQTRGFSPAITWLLIGIVVLLSVIPLIIIRDSEFGGADGAAEEAISEINPDVQPWVEPLWSPPGGETESLLFSLQAAIGAGAIGYWLGLKRGKRAG